MNIDINHGFCFRCGEVKKSMTKHHSIPQWIKPKHNITAPICKDCHDQINAADLKSMLIFAVKLEKQSEDIRKMTGKLLKQIQEYIQMEEESAKG